MAEYEPTHSAYRLAALDEDFILGDSMRGVRFLLEYAKAEENLRNWGVASTVVVFGSARIMPGGSGSASAATAPFFQARPLAPARAPLTGMSRNDSSAESSPSEAARS
ncbi:hypothetical protein [Bradyrhizobium sp. LHD-71]|uniref:hypothetical protein n=1 Tax=Bradyrhizobium sp. LHD-71 TaxID=3072141 RepID=UPI00280E88A1|nr:hypothetical protein [Bradyrhizobium sp. LHD-71]MDQ8729242.1 hypothetical protein [Bradyrhizobium sp. LHD-71]